MGDIEPEPEPDPGLDATQQGAATPEPPPYNWKHDRRLMGVGAYDFSFFIRDETDRVTPAHHRLRYHLEIGRGEDS